MELIYQSKNLSQLSQDPFLRADVDYYWLMDKLQSEIGKTPDTIKNLREFIIELETGQPIEKTDYADEETRYIHLVVRNIDKNKLKLIDPIYLIEKKGKELSDYSIEKEDIILAISSSVGECFIYEADFEDIQFTLSHYLVKIKVDKYLVNPYFLVYYLNTAMIKNYFRATETGKTQKNLSKEYIRKLPFPDIDISKQNQIIEKILPLEKEIKNYEKQLKPLQNIVDGVLIDNNIKKKYQESFFEVLSSLFSNIKNQIFLRCGAQYRAFWDIHDGLLYEETNRDIPIMRLSDLMKLMNTKTLKKGILEDEYILIELEDIEAGTGRIINEDKVVNEIGSDKVCFEDCDLITSKIDPYLGYTVLNDSEKNYIGTTELLPFKVNKGRAITEYVKYLLLSHEYLAKSSLLMYGKRHPRIHPLDLLNIKVPCPDLDVQDKITKEIKTQEDKNNELRNQIEKLRTEIDEIIWETIINKEEEIR
ncbi:MAG: restriction endonuclease subunit S [Methanophagales archaeon]|nr:restriction endonuclease subunit S [Methanophagales archaeon]